MRISRVKLNKFRRFADLEVIDIPATARLVVLAGPNGSGKSSLFDAFLVHYRRIAGLGWLADDKYYNRSAESDNDPGSRVSIDIHGATKIRPGSVYVRSAYRNDPEVLTKTLTRQGSILDVRFLLNKLIQADATVSSNYQRLAAQAMEDVFVNEDAGTTMGAFRDRLIGECREPLKRLFPDLTFTGVGNPLEQGSFQFDKGSSRGFDYKNLSGGEKAAFDLILDFVVKRNSYADAIYCIDEPEAHMNTKLQGALLGELLALLPEQSQLWIGSHSIGMMRKAREMYDADQSSVVFLDFGGHDFDQPVIIRPTKPTRTFWENVLHIALDDLASLVAPRQVIICEGNPAAPIPGKNAEHDAQIYRTIFADELPDVAFISAGNSKEVAGDFLGLAAALPKVAAGMKVTRLIDRDDHAPADVAAFNKEGVTVLGRRHIESYLYDDEVLTALCNSVGRTGDAAALIAAKQKAVADSVARGNPSNDIKSAAGVIYTEAKRILGLSGVGDTQMSFARNTLAPLIKSDTHVYAELKNDIFQK